MRKNYKAPVFHLVNSSVSECVTMLKVIDSLIECGIDFCVVLRSREQEDAIEIDPYGNFTRKELSVILGEVVEMYKSDFSINRIYVNEV